MKNYIIPVLLLIIVVGIGGFLIMNSRSDTLSSLASSASSSAPVDSNIQQITLSFKNGNYYPNTIRVKAGEPVKISLDSSVGGCYRSFNIKDLGVSKLAQTPKDTIDFTPNQKGTYRFACSMGMGTGTLIVE